MSDRACVHCGNDKFREEWILERYNANGEFVEGYGHSPVMIQTGTYLICSGCGWDQRMPADSPILPRPLDND